MGTSWAEVICDFAMPIIDDVRLTDQMEDNSALFFRRLSLYVQLALPLLSRPPELDSYLKYEIKKSTYADYEWTSTEESTQQQTVLDTGLVGYQLFSCSEYTTDFAGLYTTKPVSGVTYNADTGEVTFPIQPQSGIQYSLDFYTDGTFYYELTEAQKRLLGLAIGIVWDERFSRNWLNLQAKVHDSSFDTVNESNYMRETQSRLTSNRALLNDELRRYEQDLAYSNTVTPRTNLRYV